ncbi:MAG: carboxypeptidase-like regulatory domain-containing protein [Planctomycetota bacterium]
MPPPAASIQVEAHAAPWPVVVTPWDGRQGCGRAPGARVTARRPRGRRRHRAGLAGATVAWQLAGDALPDQYRETITTAADGSFTLTIPAGHGCFIDAFDALHDAARVEVPPLASQADAARWSPVLTLNGAAAVMVRVAHAGQPLRSLAMSNQLLDPRTASGICENQPGVFHVHWPASVFELFLWGEHTGPAVLVRTSLKAPAEPRSIELHAEQTLELHLGSAGTIPQDVPVTLAFDQRIDTPAGTSVVSDVVRLAPRSFPFRLPLVNDWRTVAIDLDGVAIPPARLVLAASEWPDGVPVMARTITLQAAAARWRVRVQDREQRPIPGAALCLGDGDLQPRQRVYTDRDGCASLALWPGHATASMVAVSASGFVGLAFDAGAAAEAIVTMVPAARIAGRVLDERDQPIESVAIAMQVNGIEWRYPEDVRIGSGSLAANLCFADEDPHGDWPIGGRSDRLGQFALDGLPAGANVSLTIVGERHFLPHPVNARAGASDVELRALTMAPVVFRFPSAPRGGHAIVEIHWSPSASDPSEHYEVFRQRIGTIVERGASNALSGMLVPGSYQITWAIDHVQHQGLPSVGVSADRLTIVDIE